jgi:phycobilisome core-membrane linker protein
MHRRLLGRPTFGRWEINAYFDTAARQGFYGVVDAMINSREYNECFGEDTVPYERFITAADRNARKVPALRRAFDPSKYVDLSPTSRPDVPPTTALRTVADTVPRNLPQRRPPVVGSWNAQIAGGESMASPRPAASGPDSLKQPPVPTRSWRFSPSNGTAGVWSSGVAATTTATPARSAAPAGARVIGNWTAKLGQGLASGIAQAPGAAMDKAFRPESPQGFRRRQSLSRPVRLVSAPGRDQVAEVISATYRQLLNRDLYVAERLSDAESQLNDGQIDVAGFVALVASTDLFLNRLNQLAPLRAASGAYLALLGRAPQPSEASRFLATRVRSGLPTAIAEILDSPDYASAFARDTVPYWRGLETSDGIPLATVNKTASLYGGNAALKPNPKSAT